jgi:hypothetical protein
MASPSVDDIFSPSNRKSDEIEYKRSMIAGPGPNTILGGAEVVTCNWEIIYSTTAPCIVEEYNFGDQL